MFEFYIRDKYWHLLILIKVSEIHLQLSMLYLCLVESDISLVGVAYQSGSHQKRDETLQLGNLRRVSKRLLTKVWTIPGDHKRCWGGGVCLELDTSCP